MVKIVSGGGGVFKTDKRIFHELMQGYVFVFLTSLFINEAIEDDD